MTWAVMLRADSESARVLRKNQLTEDSNADRAVLLTESLSQELDGFLGICTRGSTPNRLIWHYVPQGDVLHVIHGEDMPEPEARQAFGFAPR